MLKDSIAKNKPPLKPDYARWVVDGQCTPQVAACLILNVNPDICIVKNSSDYRNVTIRVTEADQICRTLCDNGRPWWYYSHLTIFDHVDTAIKNRIHIAKGLMKEINKYFANCIEADKTLFIKKYPYLARKLGQPIDLKPKKAPTTDTFTEKERPQVLQIILGMAMHGYNYTPDAQKNTATGNNKDSIRAALQSNGLDVTEDTIRKYLKEAADMFPQVKFPKKI